MYMYTPSFIVATLYNTFGVTETSGLKRQKKSQISSWYLLRQSASKENYQLLWFIPILRSFELEFILRRTNYRGNWLMPVSAWHHFNSAMQRTRQYISPNLFQSVANNQYTLKKYFRDLFQTEQTKLTTYHYIYFHVKIIWFVRTTKTKNIDFLYNSTYMHNFN